jgi:hypothetical protein
MINFYESKISFESPINHSIKYNANENDLQYQFKNILIITANSKKIDRYLFDTKI